MSPSLYQKIINNLVEIDFAGRISFDFYNEPLLHPELTDFVILTRAQLPRSILHLYSNGSLLTLDRYRGLRSAGIDKFVITKHEAEFQSLNGFAFDATYLALTAEEKRCVVYRSHHDLKLVNRGGLLPHLGRQGLPLVPCHLPSHMLTFTVAGLVLPCFEDFREEQVFGDIHKQKLVDILASEKYVQFRRDLKRGLRHLHRPCQNCNRTEVLPPFDV